MAKRKKHFKVLKRSRKRRILSFIFKFALGCFFLALFSSLLLVFYYIKDLPRPESFLEKKVFESTKIYDRTGEVLLYTIHGEEKREVISIEEMSDYVKNAVIVTEDKNFYQHRGVDIKGTLRAILVDLQLRTTAQGGSTITQQLIRSSLLTRNKTAERKVREIVLSLELERRYSKDQILEWYLNQVPFGSNSYGVEAASQTFFRKDCKDISLAEAATLASLIQAPSRLSPYGKSKEELLKRKDYILTKMASSGFITEEECEKAKEETIEFAKIIEPIKAPHFTLYIKDQLIKKYGQDFLDQKGLKVYTSLDWDLQKTAKEIVKKGTETNKNYNAHNASLVAMDPKTGEILSMIGSADWFGDSYPKDCISGKSCLFDPKFNIAIGTENSFGRQPGSSFKPFAYAAAFKKGFTSETILWDAKTEFNLSCDPSATQTKDRYGLECYHPNNYDGQFRGPITMRSSLAQSINLTSVKTLYLAGVKETIDLAESLGITTLTDPSRYGLALVLGGGEVKLLDMVSAYGTFATEGLTISPVSILKIEDSKGNIIEENKKTPKRTLNPQVCRVLNNILSDNKARTPMFGASSPLYIEGYQVAAKTGTTQEYRDAWTIGFTPSIVIGVWVGNNDNSPTAKKPGAVLAAPIWHELMESILQSRPKENFTQPDPISTTKPVLNGKVIGNHSILHYVDKNNPQGPVPLWPQDQQYSHWEAGI